MYKNENTSEMHRIIDIFLFFRNTISKEFFRWHWLLRIAMKAFVGKICTAVCLVISSNTRSGLGFQSYWVFWSMQRRHMSLPDLRLKVQMRSILKFSSLHSVLSCRCSVTQWANIGILQVKSCSMGSVQPRISFSFCGIFSGIQFEFSKPANFHWCALVFVTTAQHRLKNEMNTE